MRSILFLPVLLSLFLSVEAQVDTVQYFSKDVVPMSSLCSQTMVLDSKGKFFQERGCEGGSIVSYGTYQSTTDGTLRFGYLPPDSIKMINAISVKAGNKLNVQDTVKLISLEGDTLAAVFIDLSGRSDSSTNCMNQWFLKIGERSDTVAIAVDKVAQTYRGFYHGELPLGTGSVVIISLGIPRIFLFYSNWETESGEDFELVRRPFGLYSKDGLHRMYTLNR